QLDKKKKISICFYLAAESLVESGHDNPYHTFHTNVLGTLNILELARIHALEKVIISSSSHVYGDNKLPYKEKYTPKPTRPYETSKTCTDIIAQSYADSFNLPVLIGRFINIYGPGDKNFNRLIPKTIKSVFTGDSPTMWGGRVIREYLFIDDAISAYLTLAMHTPPQIKSNRIFNFGSGTKMAVEEVINKIILLTGINTTILTIPTARVDEIKKQYVSWTKAKRVLGWKPQVRFDEGLQKTVLWYKDYFKKTKHTSKEF
ncbi:MAG TPA: GDP-mannose 4,6-dehydratase, partial [Candidatus Saccharimonadales bacterium]|nr:GDP-mannose 4,6-dehydratase [Candidatus Saccharimonadales bacterium]